MLNFLWEDFFVGNYDLLLIVYMTASADIPQINIKPIIILALRDSNSI